MAIDDMTQFVPSDISTVAMGMAASMGQTLEGIRAGGDRGARFTAEEARDHGFVDHAIDRTGRVGT